MNAHLTRLRSTYTAKRDAMQQALEAHFSDLAEWQLAPDGLFFWLEMRELLPEMLERGVAFMPGEVFFPSGSGEVGYARLNFSRASAEVMERRLQRLASVSRQRIGSLVS